MNREQQATSATKPKRGVRLRIRTWLMMCVVLGPGCNFAWECWTVHYCEWNAAESLLSKRSKVDSDFLQRYGLFPPKAVAGRVSLTERILSRPTSLELATQSAEEANALLREAASIRGLKMIRLEGEGFADESLARLRVMDQLEELWITETSGLNDRCVYALTQCPSLRLLILSGADITDDTLLYLVHFRDLEELYLCDTQLSEDAFVALRNSLPDTKVYTYTSLEDTAPPQPAAIQ